MTSVQSIPTHVERPIQPLGVQNTLQVFTSPRRLFARVEDTSAYSWSLVFLLAFVVLIGYVKVQSGLIDRVVDQQTQQDLATLENNQGLLIDRIELRDRMETVMKAGEFNKVIYRLGAIALTPAYILASYLLIASVLYAVVALTGRKPEYHTLMSICVYAGFIELLGLFVQLGMVFYYRTIYLDTSLASLVPHGESTWLVAVDPFRIWFWGLIIIGLIVTKQLSRRMAFVSCFMMGLLACGVRVAASYAQSS